MADPVAQIFQQAQFATGGQGFGDFFARGVQIAQQDRQLDQADRRLNLEEEQTRLANISTALKVKAGEASQLARLAMQEQDVIANQRIAQWYNSGSPVDQIDEVMQSTYGTSDDNPVRDQFIKRADALMTLQDRVKERAQITSEERAARPTLEKQQLARQRIIDLVGPAAKLSVDAEGNVTGSTPTGRNITTRINPDGTVEVIETSGAGESSGLSAAGINKVEEGLGAATDVAVMGANMINMADPSTIGPGGLVSRILERLGVNDPGAASDLATQLPLFRAKIVPQLKSDSNIAEPERAGLTRELELNFIDNPKRYKRAMARTSRLLVESAKRKAQRAGLSIPDILKVDQLDVSLLTPREIMERFHSGGFGKIATDEATLKRQVQRVNELMNQSSFKDSEGSVLNFLKKDS